MKKQVLLAMKNHRANNRPLWYSLAPIVLKWGHALQSNLAVWEKTGERVCLMTKRSQVQIQQPMTNFLVNSRYIVAFWKKHFYCIKNGLKLATLGRRKGLNKLRLRTRTRISCRAFISLEVADSRLLPKCKMGSFIEFIFHSALKKFRTRCQTLQRISFVAVSPR